MRNKQLRQTIEYQLRHGLESELDYHLTFIDGRRTGLRKQVIRSTVTNYMKTVIAIMEDLEDNELAQFYTDQKAKQDEFIERTKSKHVKGELSRKSVWFNKGEII